MSVNQPAKQKIPHEVIVRAPGLLPMFYKTRELAEDLGADQQSIVRWRRTELLTSVMGRGTYGSMDNFSPVGLRASVNHDLVRKFHQIMDTASDAIKSSKWRTYASGGTPI